MGGEGGRRENKKTAVDFSTAAFLTRDLSIESQNLKRIPARPE
jgi:hypothetical protein